ncbi:MAG: DegT/DnrJ/EryC1/StrS family aminotransferase, partial [Terriglobales bacterium]
VSAALGREQLRKLPSALRTRRRNAALLTRGLAGVPGITLPRIAKGASHAFNLFTIFLDPKTLQMSREELQAELARRGVETAVHYPLPLHRQPIFRGCGSDRDFPVSTRLAKTVLSIPVHPGLTRDDVHRVVEVLREVVGSAARA